MEITKLMSCMNFQIMIQVMIKCFWHSTDKTIQENLNDASR